MMKYNTINQNIQNLFYIYLKDFLKQYKKMKNE